MRLFIALIACLITLFIGVADSAETYRVCRSFSSYPGCDFVDLDSAINNAIAGSTIEICGPATFDGPTVQITKLLHFVCANDCSKDPNRGSSSSSNSHGKKKKKPAPKSTSTRWSTMELLAEKQRFQEQQNEQAEKQSLLASKLSAKKQQQNHHQQQQRNLDDNEEMQRFFSKSDMESSLLQKRARTSNSDSSTSWDANRGSFGTTSQVMLTPIRPITTVLGPITTPKYVVFDFASSAVGSSVFNCEFLCQTGTLANGIDIGIAGFEVDRIKVEHNNFEQCYFGVYMSQGKFKKKRKEKKRKNN